MTILVPIDFSRSTRRVLREAVELARATDGCLVLLHSVTPPPIPDIDVPTFAGREQYVVEGMETAATRHLRRLQRRLTQRGTRVKAIGTFGIPVLNIIAQARKLSANYIVIGSHGHSALYNLVLGSTTCGVLKRARCPVIVVPPSSKKSPRQRPRPALGVQFDPTR